MTVRGGRTRGARPRALLRALPGLLCTALAALPAAAVAAEDTALVQAFGSLPQVRGVVLSPDGALLAWQDAAGSDPQVVIFDIAASANLH